MIRGIHHISLSTNDIDAMLHFYRDLMGLEYATNFDWPVGTTVLDKIVGLEDSATKTALLKAGNTYVEIFQYLSPAGAPGDPQRPACDVGLTHICFDVTDVDSEYERLKAAGVTFNTEPLNVGPVRTTYGRDPDGNLFEIQEVVERAPELELTTLVPAVERGLK